jgi:SAM-dependent methyltransferase
MLRRRFQNRFDSWKACLEVGCYDGLVSFWLASSGKRCLGIDMSTEGFDPRAREQGVRFSRMDAQQLACENNRFDFVCSFNAFEHIPDPARALREAVRVLRPGGIVYVACAPLYAAPFGLHAPEIGIPYAQFLFSPEALNAYCAEQGLRRIDFGGVNGWSPAQYRQSVDSLDGVVVEQYLQIYDPRYLGIIYRYPGQFKRSGRAIDDFLIGGLEIVLRKG